MILYTCLVALLPLHETFHLERLVLSLAVLRLKSGRSPNCRYRTDVKGGLKFICTDPSIYRNFVSVSLLSFMAVKVRGKTHDALWTFH